MSTRQNKLKALVEDLKIVRLADSLPFPKELIACLCDALADDEDIVEALAVEPGGLLATTYERVLYVNWDAATQEFNATEIPFRDIAPISSQAGSGSVRIDMSVRNVGELTFMTPDVELAENFVDFVGFTADLHQDDEAVESVEVGGHELAGDCYFDAKTAYCVCGQGWDCPAFQANLATLPPPNYVSIPVGGTGRRTVEEDGGEGDSGMEHFASLLIAAWPFVKLALESKLKSGEEITISTIAARIGIPAFALTMMAPMLTEKLEELLRGR